MSQNIKQIFTNNPLIVNQQTDLMYVGQSPFGAGNDAAISFGSFAVQFVQPLNNLSDLSNIITARFNISTDYGYDASTYINLGVNTTMTNPIVTYTDVSFSLGSLALTLPPANAATSMGRSGTGRTFIIRNIGSNDFAIKDNSGTQLIAAVKQGYVIELTLVNASAAGAYVYDVKIANGGNWPLALGGTNASLTASNGGIVYSTASALAILAATTTANQMLMSGASTTPAWSTATWPATTTINQILYSSSANTVTGISSVNSAVLTTSGSGVPSFTTTLNGIVIGNLATAAANFTTVGASGQITSTVSTGSAPFVVASTTRVSNLNAATCGTADSVTTNANLTGDVTSSGNATTYSATVPINKGGSAATTALGALANYGLTTVNTDGTTTRTVSSTDAFATTTMTSASGITITFTDAGATNGYEGIFIQAGAGQITFAAGTGITNMNTYPASTLKTAGQFAVVWWKKTATGVVYLKGDLTS